MKLRFTDNNNNNNNNTNKNDNNNNNNNNNNNRPGNPRLTDDPCIFKSIYGKYRSKSIATNQHQQRI